MPATAAATARTTTAPRRAPARKAPARRTARSHAAPRRAPARKPQARRAAPKSTRRRTGGSTITGRFVPVAVGRIPVAVGGLADSGLMVRLTRGRLWIGFLGALLIGIVALNVLALSFSANSSRAGAAADELERQNSAARAQIARDLSNGEVQGAASKLGLAVPEPGSIGYVKVSSDDADVAAKRLRSGDLTAGATSTVPTTTTVPETSVVPVTTDPTATTVPATTTPTTPTDTTADPTATAADPTATATQASTDPTTLAAGGVSAP
jgi:cell division septation protein DedD